jgi:hydrogenase 3 maturation protease
VDYFEELEKKLKARIGRLPPEKVVFVGVGNRYRCDDAIGPLIIDMLKEQFPNAIDAGPTPEDVTGEVRRLTPEAVIFIDALFMKDLPPGTPVITDIDEIQSYGGLTHTYSIDIVMEYLKNETHADLFMIGVQPGRIADGEKLSPGIGEAIEKIAACIRRSLGVG